MGLGNFFKKKVVKQEEEKETPKDSNPLPEADHEHVMEYIGDYPAASEDKKNPSDAKKAGIKYVPMEKCKICGMTRTKE